MFWLEFHVGDVFKRHENFIFKITIVCYMLNTLPLMVLFMLFWISLTLVILVHKVKDAVAEEEKAFATTREPISH